MHWNFTKLTIDLSDFYLYSRIFLDTLATCIYLSFRVSGNKKAGLLGQRIKFFIDGRKMETYKNEIDRQFFNGLEEKLHWVNDFRKSRDELGTLLF